MKRIAVSILIVSSVVLANPTEQDYKLVKEAGESIGVDLSFSREVNLSNVEKMCQSGFKTVPLSLEKTPQMEVMAVKTCVSQWKSLR